MAASDAPGPKICATDWPKSVDEAAVPIATSVACDVLKTLPPRSSHVPSSIAPSCGNDREPAKIFPTMKLESMSSS